MPAQRHGSIALDSVITIPGTSIRLGLDPILGLLLVGVYVLIFLVSLILVVEAARLGLPITPTWRSITVPIRLSGLIRCTQPT